MKWLKFNYLPFPFYALLCVFLLSVLIFLFTVLDFGKGSNHAPVAEAGVLHLTGWDLQNEGPIKLDGVWDFHWEALLTLDDLRAREQVDAPALRAAVPGVWNRIVIDGRNLPGEGYATYRLQVKGLDTVGELMGLRIYNLATAYSLQLDGRQIASNGVVASAAQHAVSAFKPVTVFFQPPAPDFDIIVQISNFEYARGGFWASIHLGTAGQILKLQNQRQAQQIFVIGALFMIGLYFLFIYLYDRKARSNLYFGVLCFTLIIVADVLGQFFIVDIFPLMSFATLIRIWFLAVLWAPFFLVMFINEMFPTRFARPAAILFFSVNMIMFFIYLFMPVISSSRDLFVSNLLPVAAIFYTILIAVGAARRRVEGSYIYLTGMVIGSITVIHDILLMNNIIRSAFGELMCLGIFSVVMAQVLMQAKLFVAAYREKVLLLDKLNLAMAELRVSLDKELQAELKFLQSQIRPHFIHNALHTIISISRSDAERARKLLLEFSHYLRGCFNFRYLDGKVPIERELNLIQSYVAIEQARFGEKLQVHFDMDDISFLLPPLILQPLVENAILHGLRSKAEGGTVLISIKRLAQKVRLAVKDDGVGMTEQGLADLESGSPARQSVGLYNINQRLGKLYGASLIVQSVQGVGTEVSIEIPFEGVELSA